MIFVIWKDYDGTRIDKFDNGVIINETAKAEDLITSLVNGEDENGYGTEILGVIDGKEVSYEVVKQIEKIKIVKEE